MRRPTSQRLVRLSLKWPAVSMYLKWTTNQT